MVIGAEEKAPNFVMQVFDVEPGASSPHQSHGWEHEVFLPSGQGRAYGGDGEAPHRPGYTAYIPPTEEHHFVNTGDEVLRSCV